MNNITQNKHEVKFNYKFDPKYYDLHPKKRLSVIDELSQGK